MKKRIFGVTLISAILAQTICSYALELTSDAAIVTDAETGECYYEMNADEPLAPASMTKVMTAYIIYEKMDDGFFTKDTLITADEDDEAEADDPEATNVDIVAGEAYTVDEILGAILVPSACAACEMIGKYISGSKEAFVSLMNQTVGSLGLEAYYEDASGLSDNNRISARSMAQLARTLITKHPDVLNYTSKQSVTFGGKTYNSTNSMLPGRSYEYSGVDGLKTGTTTLAGCCFTGTALNNGHRLISVTMHSQSGSERFSDTKCLLDFGFDRINYLYNNLFCTDMRLFINGAEVPAFVTLGGTPKLCLLLEDLKDYGFSVYWDKNTNTISAEYIPGQQFTPIPMDYYKTLMPAEIYLPILSDYDTKAELIFDKTRYSINEVFPLGFYTAIPVDELVNIAKSGEWNSVERRFDITL
ncbi:MAG: D-alanyl-D-alanine carboxypeptidase family protein [bacterium]|nr:D-alanyl-D-alanine carboxypeptidase family protein [bacterium]